MSKSRHHAEASPSAKRFFVTLDSQLEAFPAEVTVSDEFTVHHLRTVMRAKPQEAVTLVDGEREISYAAIIQDLQKQVVILQVTQKLEIVPSRLPYAVLVVSLIKEQRWDWLLQKATELGVRTFQPLLAERSVIRLDAADIPKKLERWQAVLRSAAEQSEGLFVPAILPPLTVKDYLASLSPGAMKLILRERGEERQTLKRQLAQLQPGQPSMFAIGPEGGWSDKELAVFEQAGFVSVSLGERILRSETAAIAAVSALVYESGV